MSDTQTQPLPQRSGATWWSVLVLLSVIAYLGWKLHDEEQRATPAMPQAFESRVEAVRTEGTDWSAGYFYMVGKTTPQPSAQPQLQQAAYRPAAKQDEDPVLRSIREQNDAWERHMRSQGFDAW